MTGTQAGLKRGKETGEKLMNYWLLSEGLPIAYHIPIGNGGTQFCSQKMNLYSGTGLQNNELVQIRNWLSRKHLLGYSASRLMEKELISLKLPSISTPPNPSLKMNQARLKIRIQAGKQAGTNCTVFYSVLGSIPAQALA